MSSIVLLLALIVVGAVWFLVTKRNAPSAVVNKNQEVIDNLIKHGSDPEKEHFIEFAFYGDREKFPALEQYLISKEYQKVSGQASEMVVVGKWMKLHLQKIESEIALLERTAQDFGLEFDGWGAQVEKITH